MQAAFAAVQRLGHGARAAPRSDADARLRAAEEAAAARGRSGAARDGQARRGGATRRRGDAAPRTVAVGAITSREDAIRALDRVCEWIERNEPSNPAPLLIRRAQRLMTKNFIEIIRDLAPEGVNQIEKLAGTQTKS